MNEIVNQDFQRAVKQMRRILPKLSFGLLIGTYLISALIMGIFHSQNSTNIGFTIAAFLVPLAIQTGRGTIVFFFQLNPARIQSRFSTGIVAATVLMCLSLWEAYLVMTPYGLSWVVSVSTLMVIGWIVELMILKETMFATQMQLYQNKAQWNELEKFYIARAEFDSFMDNLRDGKLAQAKDIAASTLPEAPAKSRQAESVFDLSGEEHAFSPNGHYAGN